MVRFEMRLWRRGEMKPHLVGNKTFTSHSCFGVATEAMTSTEQLGSAYLDSPKLGTMLEVVSTGELRNNQNAGNRCDLQFTSWQCLEEPGAMGIYNSVGPDQTSQHYSPSFP